MQILHVVLPAAWACALVNDDWRGLERRSPSEAAKARSWLLNSGLKVLSSGEHTFYARFDGVLTKCLEYECTPRHAS